MIENYKFEKNIKKIDKDYFLEIILPGNFNNFVYKIYGDKGFIQQGKFTAYKIIKSNNIITIIINKLQYIFINISIKNKKEYFDFINMKNYYISKNIKMNIKRNDENNILIDKMIEQFKENNISDVESSSDDEEEDESK